MSIGSNTAQTRELSELRNHLKWLDEERRKSARKMAELEQRLAQQGRDLAERDQKIQDLEWHIANFNERFERLPDFESGSSAHEQRLHDLEWQLTNVNAQLTRVNALSEELNRVREETGQSVVEAQQRLQADQALVEGRLMSELANRRAAEERLTEQLRAVEASLPSGQEEQAAMLEQLEQQLAALQERAVAGAAESQTLISNLAAQFQMRIDAVSEQIDSQVESLANPQLDGLEQQVAELRQQLDAQVAGLDQRLGLQVAELDQRLDLHVAELGQRLDGQEAQVGQRLDLQVAELGQRLDAQVPEIDERLGLVVVRITELEESVARIGNVRDMMSDFARIDQELELREAEELRLANLISQQDARIGPVVDQVEELREKLTAVLGQAADMDASIDELRLGAVEFRDNWKPMLMEANRRLPTLTDRLTVLNNNVLKTEASLQSVSGDQMEMREAIANLTEDVRRSQGDLNSQMEAWQATLDEHKDTIERFTQQWITLSNQYKEARMAVQNFAHWQKQLEQQKREASEMLRIESNRMQGRWDGFLLEVQEKLKNFELDLNQKWQAFELDNEQKWAAARRGEQAWRDQLSAVDELITKLQQDNRTLIWRVQAAQAEAFKKWPRMLMEEVEKAVELNPNRRLQPAAPGRGDMSVVDALEQGLIKVDYSDDALSDL